MVFSNDWGARWHSPKAIYGTFNFKTKLVDVDRDGNLTNEVKQDREKGLEYITSLNSYSGILYDWKTNVMGGYILDTTLLEVANGNITDPNSLDDNAKVVAPKTVDFSIGVADVTKTYKQEIVEIKNEANQAMDNTKLPVKKGVYKIKVRTTYEDGTFDESINTLTITKDVPQSTLYNPKPMDIIVNVDETPEAESGISNKDELPGETTFIFKNGKPDTSKVATYPVEIIVKYPDKTEAVVKTNLIVKGKPIKLIKLQKAQPIVKPKPESEVETVPSVPPVVDAVPNVPKKDEPPAVDIPSEPDMPKEKPIDENDKPKVPKLIKAQKIKLAKKTPLVEAPKTEPKVAPKIENLAKDNLVKEEKIQKDTNREKGNKVQKNVLNTGDLSSISKHGIIVGICVVAIFLLTRKKRQNKY